MGSPEGNRCLVQAPHVGGTDAESNLVAACEDCNRGKGSDVEMRLERFDLPNGKVLFEYPDHTRPNAAEMGELLGHRFRGRA